MRTNGSGSARRSVWSGSAGRAAALGVTLVLVSAAPARAASAWSLVPGAPLVAAGESYLDGVSCASAAAQDTTATCFAVGSLVTLTGTTRPLVERWTGRGWKVMSSPTKQHAIASALVGVSCASPKSCMAVGNSRASEKSRSVPLIARWNGSRWSIVPSPTPKGTTGTYLNAVSCASAKSCVAVGNYTSSFSSGSTLVERWNGSKWSLMPSPNPAKAATTALNGVSCTGAGAAATCLAVGSFSTSAEGTPFYTVTERMVHGKWVLIASPNAHTDHNSNLLSVSCASAKSCIAAGVWQHGYGATFVEHWNGARWAVVKTPNPRGFTFGQLSAVSCASTSRCVATGTYSMGTPVTRTLVEQWDGRAWKIQSSPDPAKSASSALNGVSCIGSTRCIAVGTYLTNKFGNPAAGFSQHRS